MALIYPQNGDLTKLLKSAPKKVPQSARLSAGRGVQKLKGQCPNAPCVNLRNASLSNVKIFFSATRASYGGDKYEIY